MANPAAAGNRGAQGPSIVTHRGLDYNTAEAPGKRTALGRTWQAVKAAGHGIAYAGLRNNQKISDHRTAASGCLEKVKANETARECFGKANDSNNGYCRRAWEGTKGVGHTVANTTWEGLKGAAHGVASMPVPGLGREPDAIEAHKTAAANCIRDARTGNGGTKTVYSNAHMGNRNYDPRNRNDLCDYVDQHCNQLHRTDEGHQYILNPTNSSFIFIPNGDRSKICEIALWDKDTGKPFTDSTTLNRCARVYMIAHETITKQNTTLGKPEGHFNTVIIDFSTGSVRGYNNLKPDEDISYLNGTTFDIDEKLWKEMRNFFDDSKTDGKKSLKGEKVEHDEEEEGEDPLAPLRMFGGPGGPGGPPPVPQNVNPAPAPVAPVPIVEEPEEDSYGFDDEMSSHNQPQTGSLDDFTRQSSRQWGQSPSSQPPTRGVTVEEVE